MLRQLGIRWKFLAVLALPVLVLAGASAALTGAAATQVRTARQTGTLPAAAGQLFGLQDALEQERQLAVATVAPVRPESARPGAAALSRSRAGSDAALSALLLALGPSGDSNSAAVRATLVAAGQIRTGLARIRAAVDRRAAPGGIASGYGELIAAVVQLPATVAEPLADRDQAGRLQTLSATAAAIEAVSRQQLAGLQLIRAGSADPAVQQSLAVGAAELAGALAELRDRATVEQLNLIDRTLTPAAAAAADRLVTQLELVPAGQPVRVSAADFARAAGEREQQLHQIGLQVAQDAVTESERAVDAARLRAELVLALAVLLVGLSVLFALMQSRRTTAPLRRLTAELDQLAEGLPALVARVQAGDTDEQAPDDDHPAGGRWRRAARDEVSRLAAAFRAVHVTTVRVAREQARLRAAVADTFVTIARRNQVLLSRQLAFIDQLERTEEDPDALDNLFRLDHLATRMRRNAESLLVLAGIDAGRRVRQPMPLSDVVRTAVSEIEQYDRVQVRLDADPPVVSHLALGLAHLVAEVIENATQFSDPDSAVVVTSEPDPDGIRLQVHDSGLGLPADELDRLNRQLAEPGQADVMGAQRLGLFVVARLAERIGARVWLRAGAERGTVAELELSHVLFVPGSIPPAGGSGPQPRPEPVPVGAVPVGAVPVAAVAAMPVPAPAGPVLVDLSVLEPEPVLPEAVLPEAVLPEAVLPEAVLPEAVLPEAVLPEAVLPEAVLPGQLLSEPAQLEPVPELPMPEALLPEPPPVPLPRRRLEPAPQALPARRPEPEARPEPAPEAKLEAEPEARPEPAPEARPDPVPEARPEAEPEAGPEPEAPPVLPAQRTPAQRTPGPTTMDVLPHHARSGFRLGRRHRAVPVPPPAATAQPAARWVEPVAPAPAPVAGLGPTPAEAPARPRPSRPANGFLPAPEVGPDEQRLRHALTSEALTELSRLSSYSPDRVTPAAPASLVRRTPSTPVVAPVQAESAEPIPAEAAEPVRAEPQPHPPVAELPMPSAGPQPQTADRATAVRQMLSGFQAGVRRGKVLPVPASSAPTDEWRTSQ